MLIFVIVYLRDFGFDYYFFVELFEIFVFWDRVIDLCCNVKEVLKWKCVNFGIKYLFLVICRVMQIYDVGVCVYFYFGFNYCGLFNLLEMYDVVESVVCDEVFVNGGSLFYYYGVGKFRKKWFC